MLDSFYKVSRWSLGAVFINAGASKLVEPTVFSVLIDAYGLLPDNLLLPVAIGLPAVEVIAGVGLLFDIRGSLSVIAVLLGLFIGILSYGIGMGLDVDCGCFGPNDPEAKAFHGLKPTLYRDFVMLAAIAFLFYWRRYRGIKPIEIASLFNKQWKWRTKNEAV